MPSHCASWPTRPITKRKIGIPTTSVRASAFATLEVRGQLYVATEGSANAFLTRYAHNAQASVPAERSYAVEAPALEQLQCFLPPHVPSSGRIMTRTETNQSTERLRHVVTRRQFAATSCHRRTFALASPSVFFPAVGDRAIVHAALRRGKRISSASSACISRHGESPVIEDQEDKREKEYCPPPPRHI